MKLLNLITKNFKLLLRSKTSALIIFIGPLLLVSLLGLAYSHSDNFTLTASIYSDTYTDLSESLVKKLSNQNIKVMRQDSLENCINSVKRSESQACVVFPPGMMPNQAEANTVSFYVDYSQINIVWIILDVMEARVSERSSELTMDLARDMFDRMWYVQDKVSIGKGKIKFVKETMLGISNTTQSAKTDVSNLDINVTFDVSVKSTQKLANEVLLATSDIKTDIAEAVTALQNSVDTIEGRASSIENDVNETGVLADVETIKQEVSNVESELDDLESASSNNNQDIVDKITELQNSLSSLTSKVNEAERGVEEVKAKRQNLLPQFDTLNTDIQNLVLNLDALASVLDEAVLKIQTVKVRDPASVASPIKTEIKPISKQNTHFNSLFPVLVVLIVMITGVLLGSTLVIGEKKSRSFFRNNIVPTSYFTFSMATYITALLVLLVQLILFISVSAFFFETQILISLWLIALLVFLISTLFIIVGMFVGFLFSTEATSTLASITLASIFLLFSRTVIPAEGLSETMQKVVAYNPFVISELALRETVLFNFGFDKLGMSFVLLAGYAFGVFLLLLILQDLLRRLSFMQFNKQVKPTIVKEKKAAKKLLPDEPKFDNAANELLIKSPDEAEKELKEKK